MQNPLRGEAVGLYRSLLKGIGKMPKAKQDKFRQMARTDFRANVGLTDQAAIDKALKKAHNKLNYLYVINPASKPAPEGEEAEARGRHRLVMTKGNKMVRATPHEGMGSTKHPGQLAEAEHRLRVLDDVRATQHRAVGDRAMFDLSKKSKEG